MECRVTAFSIGLIGLIVVLGGVRAVQADPKPPIEVAAEMARLCTGDAAARAAAAEALGGVYPEAAVAVPLLIDVAGDDDDAAVRAAAVRALRRLGRIGQEDWAKAWLSMGPRGLGHHERLFGLLAALGSAASPIDVVVHFVQACEPGERSVPVADALLGLALQPPPPRELAPDVWLRQQDRRTFLTAALPWLHHHDNETKPSSNVGRAAAAVVAVLGRASVVDRSDPLVEDDTASSAALLSLVSAASAASRVAGWQLAAIGGPHSQATQLSLLAAAAKLPAHVRESGAQRFGPGESDESAPPLAVVRTMAIPALRTLGAPARSMLAEWGVARGRPADGATLDLLLDLDAMDDAKAAWARAVTDWRDARSRKMAPDPSCVYAAGRHSSFASIAATSLASLLEVERTSAPGARELLLSIDPQAPDDSAPADTAATTEDGQRARAAGCLALAWLSHVVDPALVPEGLRARTAAALRRALVLPDREGDRALAAGALAEIGRPGLVPASTLVAALHATRTQADLNLQTLVLRSLDAVGGVARADVDGITPLLQAPAPSAYATDPATRARFPAASWPQVLPAFELMRLGSTAHAETLRRFAAIGALGGATGNTEKARRALAALATDPDPRVRYRVARALRRLGP